ncbi:uncharacterized protein LOC129801622 [Phlebotomus papatasi]|uniref:uncharacterized protein LOC129801622 n=1 Tax=Phlebotomus papatasi TaxID=29031 RepID=UPI00248398BA|nr:uncharacterized protein LOC129801622 [Phlebotomus papatasi]
MKLIAIFFIVAVSAVMAKPKPAVITYSAPYVAEPAAAVVESTYHGVSAPLVASPVVSTYSAYSAPLLASPYAYATYPYATGAVYV